MIKNKLYIIHYYLNKKFPNLCFYIVVTIERIAKILGLRRQKQMLIIYGEPRSGTSFVTGLISRMGYYAGPFVWLLGSNKFNPDGYFECVPFQNEIDRLIDESPYEFESQLPKKPLSIDEKSGRYLKGIVSKGNLSLVKNNKLSFFADAVGELFPDAKWIHVARDNQEIINSNERFNKGKQNANFNVVLSKRIQLWEMSKVSKSAFTIDYSNLKSLKQVKSLIKDLEEYLEINLTPEQIKYCLELFREKS